MDTHNTTTPIRPSRHSRRVAVITVVIAALALFAAACGGDDDDAGASGPPSVGITAPTADARVGRSFDVNFVINFPIGEPDTGRDHVHLYYDGNMTEGEYGIAYGDTFTVTDLAPGQHTLQAFVAHADHSVTDAHSDEITVDVTDSDASSDTTDTSPMSSGGDIGY
jgi:hypothetical protein